VSEKEVLPTEQQISLLCLFCYFDCGVVVFGQSVCGVVVFVLLISIRKWLAQFSSQFIVILRVREKLCV
jgi:hypothetical protein